MRHYVASATQAVKSEKKARGGGVGGRGGGISCEMDRGNRSGWGSVIFVPERQLYTDMQIIPRTLQ